MLGGNFGGPVTFASGCRATVFEPIVPPSLGTAARARFGLGLPVPSGRRRPGSTFGGQPPESLCSMPESRLSWRKEMRRVFSREDAVVTSATDWRRLRTGHAERASPTCRGVRHRHVPSSGGGERGRCCWRQLQCGHGRRESRLSWRLDACRGPFGGSGADPEPWSLLQSCHVLRESEDLRLSWLGCSQRLPRESAEQLQATGVILQRRHAPCDNPPFATSTCHQPLRAVWCAHAPFGGRDPSVGLALRPLPREVRCDARAPASRLGLSWEARWRRCAATATSYAEGGTVTLRGP